MGVPLLTLSSFYNIPLDDKEESPPLPPEVVRQIFTNLNALNLSHARQVCKFWRDVIELHFNDLIFYVDPKKIQDDLNFVETVIDKKPVITPCACCGYIALTVALFAISMSQTWGIRNNAINSALLAELDKLIRELICLKLQPPNCNAISYESRFFTTFVDYKNNICQGTKITLNVDFNMDKGWYQDFGLQAMVLGFLGPLTGLSLAACLRLCCPSPYRNDQKRLKNLKPLFTKIRQSHYEIIDIKTIQGRLDILDRQEKCRRGLCITVIAITAFSLLVSAYFIPLFVNGSLKEVEDQAAAISICSFFSGNDATICTSSINDTDMWHFSQQGKSFGPYFHLGGSQTCDLSKWVSAFDANDYYNSHKKPIIQSLLEKVRYQQLMAPWLGFSILLLSLMVYSFCRCIDRNKSIYPLREVP